MSHRESKRKDTNAIIKLYPEWRKLIWLRLLFIKSPWLPQVAVLGLVGVLPAELENVTFWKIDDRLYILVMGKKVRDVAGQPWREFCLTNDNTFEFQYLSNLATKEPALLPLEYQGDNLAALSRAGKQVCGTKYLVGPSIYRHALCSDLKKSKWSKEDIAKTLGHCVTRTQRLWGNAIRGQENVRTFTVRSAREIKDTSGYRHLRAFLLKTPTSA
jgi:hypothetical protein